MVVVTDQPDDGTRSQSVLHASGSSATIGAATELAEHLMGEGIEKVTVQSASGGPTLIAASSYYAEP